ncbi:MAG: cation diffusion facilitator family transporter [Oligoflexia bacterium]|nr:cation diffusion facilitator family transporter [Oligoflexia bacterium]
MEMRESLVYFEEMGPHDQAHSHGNHDHHCGHDSLHGHRHQGHTHHGHSARAPRAIVRAMIVTIVFMAIEVAGGLLSNSLALLSDAGHMLTDVGAMSLSLFALWFARRPSTASMSFGYHRAEILGALVSGLLIWLIAGVLVYEAIARLGNPPEVNARILLGIAAVGLAANLASMGMLHSSKKENINVRAAYLHLVADSLGSVGAILAGAILWLTGWRPIDPLITIVFAGLMLYSSWTLIKESLIVLMESAPSGIDPLRVREALATLPGVEEIHDLHIWSVSSGRLALSAHLIARESEAILSHANELLEKRFGIRHTTLQIEHPERFRSERCYDCGELSRD